MANSLAAPQFAPAPLPTEAPLPQAALLPTAHNLELYRLEGFSGRRAELLQLHGWMTGGDDLPAIAISGEQGDGKSALATAAAWNHFHHFTDGILRVGAAGAARFRLYDIVRTMDTVFGTTLTRMSQERWGISILEQLYRRKRLVILDELSDATAEELDTLVDIIGHLHEAGGNSRVLFIDRNFSPVIADLVQFQHIHLGGIAPADLPAFVRARAPSAVRAAALAHVEELHAVTHGRPFVLRLVLGLMLDYGWDDLAAMLQSMTAASGDLSVQDVVAFVVENLAAVQPQVGPLLDRLVSAAGGASVEALRDLFWSDLGTPAELDGTVQQLLDRALLEQDRYHQRVIMHPVVRRYMAENAVMLGEEWDRRHATYYVDFALRYQLLPIERWGEVDVEWGNIYKGADWCLGHCTRLWQQDPLEMVSNPGLDQRLLETPKADPVFVADMRLARAYALALAHYAFWRHPLGILRWLATGAVASLALVSMQDYAWLLMGIGRQLFFIGEVERAIQWLKRTVAIFDQQDMMGELAYAYTDLGTSLRILDEPRQALRYFRSAFECVAQLGDQRGLATAYMNLGSAYYSLDDYEHALDENRKALRIAIRLGDAHLTASAFNNMGLAVEGLGRYAEAIQGYERALDIFRRSNDVVGVSTCYNNLGSASYANQGYDQAVNWYELDLALSAQRGNWTDMAATLHNLGHVALEQNALDRALGYFVQSRDLYAAFQLADYTQEEEEMIEYIHSLDPALAAG